MNLWGRIAGRGGGCTKTSSHHGGGTDLDKSREVGVAQRRHLTMGMARTLANRRR